MRPARYGTGTILTGVGAIRQAHRLRPMVAALDRQDTEKPFVAASVACFSMNSSDTTNPMLAAAARILELTKEVVLDHPDPALEHTTERSADEPPALRVRRAGSRGRQEHRRERIG